MAARVIRVDETPNPNARKYVLDRVISENPASFFNAEAAENHPLARALFAIGDVSSVLILKDFVTVNKKATCVWGKLTPKVRKILEEFYPQ